MVSAFGDVELIDALVTNVLFSHPEVEDLVQVGDVDRGKVLDERVKVVIVVVKEDVEATAVVVSGGSGQTAFGFFPSCLEKSFRSFNGHVTIIFIILKLIDDVIIIYLFSDVIALGPFCFPPLVVGDALDARPDVVVFPWQFVGAGLGAAVGTVDVFVAVWCELLEECIASESVAHLLGSGGTGGVVAAVGVAASSESFSR